MVLLGAYGLMGWSLYSQDICPYQMAVVIYRDALLSFLIWWSGPAPAYPIYLARLVIDGLFVALSLLWLPFTLQAAARLCGWRGFLPNRVGWWGVFCLAVATLALHAASYVPSWFDLYFSHAWRLPFFLGCLLACRTSFYALQVTRRPMETPASDETRLAVRPKPGLSVSGPPSSSEKLAARLLLAALLALWFLADVQRWDRKQFNIGLFEGAWAILDYLNHERVIFFDDARGYFADACMVITMALSLPLALQAALSAHGIRGFWRSRSYWCCVCAYSFLFVAAWAWVRTSEFTGSVNGDFPGADIIVVGTAAAVFCLGFFTLENSRSDS